MSTQAEMELGEEIEVIRVQVRGNLQIHGQEGHAIRAESPNGAPLLTEADEVVEIECDGDCVVHLPRQSQLEIEVNGDLLVDGVSGGVGIVECAGNASLAESGPVQIEKVSGDLRVAHCASVRAEEVRGNAHVSAVRGPVSVNAKGDAHLHDVAGSVSVNAKGNVHLQDVAGETIRANAKGDIHVGRGQGEIAANAAGNVNLTDITSQRVRAVAKGDIQVHFPEGVGGEAKVVNSGDLHLRGPEKRIRRGRGVYTFRFGQGEATLSLVAKGNVLVEGVAVDESSLRGVNEEMAAEMGAMGAELGAELGAMGAELGREFGNLGRDIARQVQEKVQRKVQAKMREMGKRTAKAEWGEGKSWSFSFGDFGNPPKPPTPPAPPATPGWDAPFDPVEEGAAGEPVSEEERGLVLRMLEEGKISAAEAAALLEALGDGE